MASILRQILYQIWGRGRAAEAFRSSFTELRIGWTVNRIKSIFLKLCGDTVWPVPDKPPEPQAEPLSEGRQFSGLRKVRLGDVTPSGRLRFDALTRYTQDVSDDDTTDAGLDTDPAWVVRRTTVDVIRPAHLAESLTFVTFCSALGRRWAERRLRITGDLDAHYEVSTLWICVDVETGRPRELTDQFHRLYGPAAGGRTVKARLTNPKPDPEASLAPWPLRTVDFDTLGHVNNAAYWALIEEALAGTPVFAQSDALGSPTVEGPHRVHLEYSAGLSPADEVGIASMSHAEAGHCWWWLAGPDRELAASASLTTLPADFYRL